MGRREYQLRGTFLLGEMYNIMIMLVILHIVRGKKTACKPSLTLPRLD
jgi:hypothetical protein